MIIWLGGSAAALVTQGVFRKRFAQHSAWGYNGGWQREIAVWNFGTIVAGLGIAASGDEAARAQLRGLMVLSTLFALNHLAAALRAPKSWSNWIGAGANAGVLATGVPALLNSRRHASAAV
ncbi:hypothetical protein [Mycobacterium parmense]|uniref:hypothetical protein n=1 Tax=Mycobacterium parmense TaxID=185642 RepID=UPI000A14D683|nr:hypothetical protein [Mycobacterium parmense]MCV7350375.1 hypothetical protein [Mycobacterium parmense]ORW59654.1 hypothetical protein AWC20_00385 [Mycobacterium parmense]